MQQALKRRWVEALRSGKYQQCRGQLKTEDHDSCRYCVLGVLADLLVKEGYGEWESSNSFKQPDDNIRYQYRLPLETLLEVGLREEHEALVISMNDGGKSFEQLASIIEETISGD